MLKKVIRLTTIAAVMAAISLTAAPTGAAADTTTPPPAPTGLTVTSVGETTVGLRWDPSPDPRVTRYYIDGHVFIDGEPHKAKGRYIPASNTSTLVEHLATASTYRFTVAAVIQPGDFSDRVESAPSEPVTFTTNPDVTPPEPPELAVSKVTPTTVTLRWSTIGVDNDSSTRHPVSFRLTNGVSTVTVTPPASSRATYTFTELTPSTTYEFRGRSIDFAGNQSPLSSPVNATTLEGVPPTTPQNLVFGEFPEGHFAAGHLGLRWEPSSDNVTPGRSLRYRLYANGEEVDLDWPPWGLDTFVDFTFETEMGTELPAGQYWVTAVDQLGNESTPSNVVTITNES